MPVPMTSAPAPRVRSVAIFLLAVLGLQVWPDPVQAEVGVDLELLLAVDVSASVEASEYTLQTKGLAWAFRDPEVRAAIRRSGPRGIAVAVVQWAGGRDPVVAIDWTHLLDEQSVTAFAIRIAAMPRLFVGDDTWIGAAVHFSVREMVSNGFKAPRKVIDLSGDGGVELIGLTQRARNAAVASGVVINGLAIENEIPNLHVFFRDNLIGGVGAFVMRASSYTDFAEIMRLKLIREIGKRSMAELVPRQLPSLGLTSGRVFGLSALK